MNTLVKMHKTMNISIKRIVTAFLLLFFTSFTCVMAQKDDSGATFTVQGDLLSSYLWRGFYQTGASFQPTFAFSVAGFSLTAWGSTDFDGYKSSEGAANKEIDLTAAYTFGQDKDEDGNQNYSSYVELNYPFRVKMVDLTATCGFLPYTSYGVYTGAKTNDGFAVTNVALKGSTAIKFSDSFSLPIFAQAIWNPRMEDAHLVFGISLRPW